MLPPIRNQNVSFVDDTKLAGLFPLFERVLPFLLPALEFPVDLLHHLGRGWEEVSQRPVRPDALYVLRGGDERPLRPVVRHVVRADRVPHAHRRVHVNPPLAQVSGRHVGVDEAALAGLEVLAGQAVAQGAEAQTLVERGGVHGDHAVPAGLDLCGAPGQEGLAGILGPEVGELGVDGAVAVCVAQGERVVVVRGVVEVHGARGRVGPLVRGEEGEDVRGAKDDVVQEQNLVKGLGL